MPFQLIRFSTIPKSMTQIMKYCFIIFLVCIGLQGCAKHVYQEEPVNFAGVFTEINSWTIDNPELNRFLKENGMLADELKSNVFTINRLFLTGLFYDPEMQVAYKKWKQAKIVVDHSDYKINPKISLPFEHHSDNADTSNLWSIGTVLSFIYERKSKQEARKAKAEVNLLNASLKIKQLALERYGLFEERYHQYIIQQATISELRNEINVLKELLAQLQRQYELGAVSQFELNSTKLELQQGVFRLTIQENNLQERVDGLLTMTHLAYPGLDGIVIEAISPLLFANSECQETEYTSAEFSDLQKTMLENHLDMAITLNQYALSEADLRLKIEKQYPDIVLSPGFFFDQSDNIWSLGSSWILPLFENTEQNLNILAALEERKIKQQKITVLQKELLSALYKIHRAILRHKRATKVSDEIINSIELRAKEIKTQIDIGGIDGVALLRNRKQFYKARQEQITVYNNAINAMLEMDHLLQSSHSEININDVVASWLKQIEERSNDELVN
jgi:outer membrane protein, heavy metal efflux system